MFTKRQIWVIVIPLMLEQILMILMGTADTMMISNAGEAAISAVALVDSINVLMVNIFSAMATGGTIICSQYIGSKNAEAANDTAEQLILTVTALSVMVMALCILFRNPLLAWIFGQVEEAVMKNASLYFWITALSYPFIALYNAGAALFRSCGNSRLPMQVSTLSNVLNIVGNAVLIFGFDMGVAGAAAATLASRIFCAAAILYFLGKPGQMIRVKDYRRIRPKLSLVARILSVGIPTGIENGMFQFGKIVVQSTVSAMGTMAIAAQAMTFVLHQMAVFPVMGVGLGMMTIVGQCIGAGRKDEAKKYIIELSIYGELVLTGCCIMIGFFVYPVTWLGGMAPEAAALTVRLTHTVAVGVPILWVFSFLPAYGMRAAGDVRYSMVLSTVSMWLFRVAVVVFLARAFHMGPLAVWIGMFCDWAVRGFFFMQRFLSGKWMNKKI